MSALGRKAIIKKDVSHRNSASSPPDDMTHCDIGVVKSGSRSGVRGESVLCCAKRQVHRWESLDSLRVNHLFEMSMVERSCYPWNSRSGPEYGLKSLSKLSLTRISAEFADIYEKGALLT